MKEKEIYSKYNRAILNQSNELLNNTHHAK